MSGGVMSWLSASASSASSSISGAVDFSSIPNCPASAGYHWASTSTVSFASGLVSLVLACLSAWNYNAIVVDGTKLRPPGISNTVWIVFFVSSSICGILRGLYMCLGYGRDIFADTTELLSNIFEALAILLASLAVDFQRRFKSSKLFLGEESAKLVPQKKPVMTWQRKLIRLPCGVHCQMLTISEIVFILCTLQFLIFLMVNQILDSDGGIMWIYYISEAVASLPIIVVTVLVVIQRPVKIGPSITSRILLCGGTALLLVTLSPALTWALILPSECMPHASFMSWFDVIVGFSLLGLVFFFFFLRAEYFRQHREYTLHFVLGGKAGCSITNFE
ncbi:hypothetical protein Pelo_6789 [Pelomyxa schiedti]|nr:hypothetical protein Pelo_6789 [Pelomyxa schiedti]